MEKHVEHIKEIVTMQQSFERASGVEQVFDVEDVIEDAIKINSAGLLRHGVNVMRDYSDDVPLVATDRHKILQILIDLISNAKYAVSHPDLPERKVTIKTSHYEETVILVVADNGIGISEEQLDKIFSYGFTTKQNGHGFGLHSCVLAATELGGSISVYSDGPNKGAKFTLMIPVGSNKLGDRLSTDHECTLAAS